MAQRRNYVFISGPYTGEYTHDAASYFKIEMNITRAHEVSAALARLGYGFFCPHTHSAHNEVIMPEVLPEYWYELDCHFLRACDALLVLPGYSKGVEKEMELARSLGMPVFHNLLDLIEDFPAWKVRNDT